MTNTGDVTITGVEINEDAFDLPGPIAITAPADIDAVAGRDAAVDRHYTLTQADIDAIFISADDDVDNSASATGNDPERRSGHQSGRPGRDPADLCQRPLSIVKDGSYNDVGAPTGLSRDDTLTYTFDVTNTGDVTITGVRSTRIRSTCRVRSRSPPPADIDLSPGETQQWTGSYTLTQADIDAIYASADDDVDNSASATGT